MLSLSLGLSLGEKGVDAQLRHRRQWHGLLFDVQFLMTILLTTAKSPEFPAVGSRSLPCLSCAKFKGHNPTVVSGTQLKIS